MKRLINTIRAVFLLSVFILGLFIAGASATSEMRAIKEFEEQEKKAPPAVIQRPKVEYTSQALRDPFQQPTEGKQSPEDITRLPSLTVQGIVWGGRFPQAIINNKVVKIGDMIEGARVIDIDKNGISLFFAGREYNLSSPAAGVGSADKP